MPSNGRSRPLALGWAVVLIAWVWIAYLIYVTGRLGPVIIAAGGVCAFLAMGLTVIEFVREVADE